MIEKLTIPYSTWKSIAQNNGFSTFHLVAASDVVTAWCGNSEYIYKSSVDAENYSDWNTNFGSSSTSVVSPDDAVARIVGLKIEPPTPRETDGRLNTVQAPMSQGNYLWICGRSDHKGLGKRGAGPRIGVQAMAGGHVDAITAVDQTNKKFTIAGDKTSEFTVTVDHIHIESSTGNDGEYTLVGVEEVSGNTVIEVYEAIPSSTADGNLRHARTSEVDIPFVEGVEIQDGQGAWNPSEWSDEDEFTMVVSFPATPFTSTPGTGNANINGTYGWFEPANGDGDYTIDLTTAVPVEASSAGAPGGFYDFAVDKWDGDLVANPTPYAGQFLCFPVELPNLRFMKSIHMNHPLGVFDIEVTKTEWIHKNWLLKLYVNRESDGTGTLSLWLQFYRRSTS